MASILVLEGPDCAGKTTLAKAIQNIDYKAKYIHMSYRFIDRMGLYHIAAIHRGIQYSMLGYNVIIDRSWPSTEIYSQIFRNDNRWNKLGYRLNPVIIRFGLQVLCLPDFETVYAHYKQNAHEQMYDLADAEKIYDAYSNLAYGDFDCKLGGLVGKLTRNGGVLGLKNWMVVDPFTSKALPERLLFQLEKF